MVRVSNYMIWSKIPYEKNDIAAKNPEVVEKFRKGFTEWFDSCKDSFEGKEYGTASLKKVKQSWPTGNQKKKKGKK